MIHRIEKLHVFEMTNATKFQDIFKAIVRNARHEQYHIFDERNRLILHDTFMHVYRSLSTGSEILPQDSLSSVLFSDGSVDAISSYLAL